MTNKVRRVDLSPDEWLAGTRGLRGFDTGVYVTVVCLIYSRGGDCPDDASYIAGQFGDERNRARLVQQTRQALDRLLKLGKLKRQTTHDGRWLTNGRADRELGRSQQRIDSAARAGVASGKVRRDAAARQRLDTGSTAARQRLKSKSSGVNDLAGTAVRNHQPSTNNHDHERANGTAVEAPAVRAQDTSAIVAGLARKRRMGSHQ